MTDTAVFDHLAGILRPYADGMIVKTDKPDHLYLEETTSGDKPQMFAAAQVKKNYTSFHLMPVYCNPDLLDGISPELKQRMQGKSCFNFKSVAQIPTEELSALVKRSYETLAT